MDKKIGLILLALLLTLGAGVGISLAQDHDPDQFVAIRAHLADTGCPYVTLGDGTTEAAVWFPPDPDIEDPQREYYTKTYHQFGMLNVYPGFGYYDSPGSAPCDEPAYVLYFVRNEDMDSFSEIGPITVNTYTLEGSTPVPDPAWLEVEPYDSIIPDISADVSAKLNSLGLDPAVVTAMETAFLNGSIQEGDSLLPAMAGETNPGTWGCYGLWIKVPFEESDGAVPMGVPAYITVAIEPPGGGGATPEVEFGPYFID